MTYDRKIFMITSLQIGHNRRIYSGDAWLFGSNYGWGIVPMLKDGTVQSNLCQILVNGTGAGGTGAVYHNSASEMLCFFPNGTTGIVENVTPEAIGAGESWCLAWTETAFSGLFDGNMMHMGVYD